MPEIPGWFDWHALYRDAVARAPQTGAHFVECGTFYGKSADFLAREILCSGKTIQFDTWDSWLGVDGPYQLWPQPQEADVRHRLSGLPVTVRTGDALQAADRYALESLDLVFLDDDHTAEHLYQECCAWWPRVKPGGLLAGHDFDWLSVQAGLLLWANHGGCAVDPVGPRCWQVWKPR